MTKIVQLMEMWYSEIWYKDISDMINFNKLFPQLSMEIVSFLVEDMHWYNKVPVIKHIISYFIRSSHCAILLSCEGSEEKKNCSSKEEGWKWHHWRYNGTVCLVTLHCPIEIQTPIKDVNSLLTTFPDQFDRVGEFHDEQHLVVDPNVPSRRDAPRKLPIALKDKVKQELDKMETQNVIKKVEEPTEWVNSITYVTKKDGSIQICLDPRHLNKALVRLHYKHQTLEELNHRFHNAQFFSKLDAKAGYWSVKLDNENQKLTTFQTPFGRYAFCRLPFGLTHKVRGATIVAGAYRSTGHDRGPAIYGIHVGVFSFRNACKQPQNVSHRCHPITSFQQQKNLWCKVL